MVKFDVSLYDAANDNLQYFGVNLDLQKAYELQQSLEKKYNENAQCIVLTEISKI